MTFLKSSWTAQDAHPSFADPVSAVTAECRRIGGGDGSSRMLSMRTGDAVYLWVDL